MYVKLSYLEDCKNEFDQIRNDRKERIHAGILG